MASTQTKSRNEETSIRTDEEILHVMRDALTIGQYLMPGGDMKIS